MSRSSRWTIPGRFSPPTVESVSKWNWRALTSVPVQFPLAGWVTRPGGLFDDGEGVVLVDDRRAGCPRGRAGSSASSGSQTRICVPLADLVRRLGRLAVDQDGAGVDDLLDHAPRVVRIAARQVRVDPLAHHPGLDDELGGGRRTARAAWDRSRGPDGRARTSGGPRRIEARRAGGSALGRLGLVGAADGSFGRLGLRAGRGRGRASRAWRVDGRGRRGGGRGRGGGGARSVGGVRPGGTGVSRRAMAGIELEAGEPASRRRQAVEAGRAGGVAAGGL